MYTVHVGFLHCLIYTQYAVHIHICILHVLTHAHDTQAYQLRPSIIFFDEIDGLAPVRSTRQDQIHSSIVSTLLALMVSRGLNLLTLMVSKGLNLLTLMVSRRLSLLTLMVSKGLNLFTLMVSKGLNLLTLMVSRRLSLLTFMVSKGLNLLTLMVSRGLNLLTLMVSRGLNYISVNLKSVDCCSYILQWNLSNPDTDGAEESVLISEVARVVLGVGKGVLFREVSS